jgi:hypothetical protein
MRVYYPLLAPKSVKLKLVSFSPTFGVGSPNISHLLKEKGTNFSFSVALSAAPAPGGGNVLSFWLKTSHSVGFGVKLKRYEIWALDAASRRFRIHC